MKNERLYQEYLYNKYKDKTMIPKDNKQALSDDCQKFNINYTDIYAKIINYQIYTYGQQLGDTFVSRPTEDDKRRVNQASFHRKRYYRNKDYLNRVAVEKYKVV